MLYNVTTKKSICSCEPQITNNNIENLNEDKFSPKTLGKEFLKTIKNSNFMVLTCYKLAIDTKELFKNIGRIIMTLFFFFPVFDKHICAIFRSIYTAHIRVKFIRRVKYIITCTF